MKTLNDVTCKRCGCTVSGMWVEHEDLIASHVCPDGGSSKSFTTSTRIVPGPGERGKDDEGPR